MKTFKTLVSWVQTKQAEWQEHWHWKRSILKSGLSVKETEKRLWTPLLKQVSPFLNARAEDPPALKFFNYVLTKEINRLLDHHPKEQQKEVICVVFELLGPVLEGSYDDKKKWWWLLDDLPAPILAHAFEYFLKKESWPPFFIQVSLEQIFSNEDTSLKRLMHRCLSSSCKTNEGAAICDALKNINDWANFFIEKLDIHRLSQSNSVIYLEPTASILKSDKELAKKWIDRLKKIALNRGDPFNHRTYKTRTIVVREHSEEPFQLFSVFNPIHGLSPSMVQVFDNGGSADRWKWNEWWEYWPESFTDKVEVYSNQECKKMNYTTWPHLIHLNPNKEMQHGWIERCLEAGLDLRRKDDFEEVPGPSELFDAYRWRAEKHNWGQSMQAEWVDSSNEAPTPPKKRL